VSIEGQRGVSLGESGAGSLGALNVAGVSGLWGLPLRLDDKEIGLHTPVIFFGLTSGVGSSARLSFYPSRLSYIHIERIDRKYCGGLLLHLRYGRKESTKRGAFVSQRSYATTLNITIITALVWFRFL
jgi:hypothetical protein